MFGSQQDKKRKMKVGEFPVILILWKSLGPEKEGLIAMAFSD